ncbi:MAG: hypothetical protein M3143_05295 [Actinomycetota bacterium]|nr:hypothetical protein [Actinomycetota bacterium]
MPDPLSDHAAMDPSQPHGRNGRDEQLPRKVHIYRSLQHQMSQLVATEASADGTVRVSVDARGVPTELVLTDRARGVDPARLSAELMSCLQRAHSTLAGRVGKPVTGSDPNTGNDAGGDDDPSPSAMLR